MVMLARRSSATCSYLGRLVALIAGPLRSLGSLFCPSSSWCATRRRGAVAIQLVHLLHHVLIVVVGVRRRQVRKTQRTPAGPGEPPAFYSVAATARLLGMSEMTLYRAIGAGEFPAVRIRGRIIVPARAIEAMADAALLSSGLVEAADWAVGETPGVA